MWFFIFTGLMTCTETLALGSFCPVVMSPASVVVEHKGSFSANCRSLADQVEGMGWESVAGGTGLQNNVTNVSLHIQSIALWELKPMCYISFLNGSQCTGYLPVTIYKIMDSVSLSSETGQMVAGKPYRMQCHVTNVAPARNLTVFWYKGEKVFHVEHFEESQPTPVSKTSVVNVTVDRGDDGAMFWCTASLIFPQVELTLPLSRLTSVLHTFTVLYPPAFAKQGNETVEVSAQSKLVLNCMATGNPKPVYSWRYPQALQEMDRNLSDGEPIVAPSFHLPGTYSCTASNSMGTSTKYFTVIEDAGNRTTFVAVVAGFALIGVVLLAAGPFVVTQNGYFSFNQANYQPTSSGPV